MSALLNSTIHKLRTEADARRVELSELDASIEALVKIQGGAVAAIRKPRGRQAKAAGNSNGAEPSPNSEAAKDTALKAFM
jgi:hypothetical protein